MVGDKSMSVSRPSSPLPSVPSLPSPCSSWSLNSQFSTWLSVYYVRANSVMNREVKQPDHEAWCPKEDMEEGFTRTSRGLNLLHLYWGQNSPPRKAKILMGLVGCRGCWVGRKSASRRFITCSEKQETRVVFLTYFPCDFGKFSPLSGPCFSHL